jgi:hypothetical protein
MRCALNRSGVAGAVFIGATYKKRRCQRELWLLYSAGKQRSIRFSPLLKRRSLKLRRDYLPFAFCGALASQQTLGRPRTLVVPRAQGLR